MVNFLKAHAQLKHVSYGDKFDFQAFSNKNYPAANIEYLTSSNAQKQKTHFYNVMLVDLIDDEVEGIEDEITSDMDLIAEDFFTFLQYRKDFIFNPNVTIDKIQDDTADRVCGIKFRIGLTVSRGLNICSIP